MRDNIHSHDLVTAFWHFAQAPRSGAVYNIGGGPASNCSVLEAIAAVERLTGRPMRWSYDHRHRAGDHIWWISDIRKFREHYPAWNVTYSFDRLIDEIYGDMHDRQVQSKGI